MKLITLVRRITACLIGSGCLAYVSGLSAEPISFTLSQTSQTLSAPGTVTFLGTVTNDSGTNLSATDFFFNFSGYDPLLLTPNQDLGTTNFLIANGSTSPLTDLFSVAVGNAAASSTLVLDMQLEDASNDLSARETVTLHINGGSTGVPEPSSIELLVIGVIALRIHWHIIRRRRINGRGTH